MASMQCYRSHQETCQTKCHDTCQTKCHETCKTNCHEKSSFVHKMTDMAGKVFNGNHHGTQSHCPGQTHGSNHSSHGHQGQGHSWGLTHHTSKTQGTNCATATNTHHANNGTKYAIASHHANGTKGHMHGHNSSCSSTCTSSHEVVKCHEKKKNKSRCNKRKDGNSSCSDSSGSDSD